MTARFWVLVVAIVVIVAAGVVGLPRLEGTPPSISREESREESRSDPIELGHGPQTLVLEISDEGSGLRRVELRVLAGDTAKTLAERHFPGSLTSGGETESERIEIPLDVAALGLPDGEATLLVVARDWSLRDGFLGNTSETSIPLRIDTQPPRLEVASGLTYVYRGGSGAAVYRVGEETAADGVRVADAFFQGHPLGGEASDPLDRVAIFAIPVDAPSNPEVRVIARDSAGNESEAPFAARIFDRQFSESAITLSESFLEAKARPLAEANGLAGASAGESFKQVNETLRQRNEERIRDTVLDASSVRRWQGGFQQMRKSKVTSHFAEKRTYWWEDRPLSKAIHYGFDLASVSAASVEAANAGGVVFAGDLGIYGNCVIIDHGLGVHSLYGHLSEVAVAVGDTVAKSQSIGRSGATGLAGGDHLHFAILVGGYYVDPLEWWDPKWVRSHIEWRLRPPEAAPPGG